jgi:hypothetical protein
MDEKRGKKERVWKEPERKLSPRNQLENSSFLTFPFFTTLL